MPTLWFGTFSHWQETMSKFSLGGLTSKSAPEQGLTAWRADFRKVEDLPDVKVIRTDFLLNYGLVALALGVAAFAVSRELDYASMRKEIEVISAEIDAKRVTNEANLKTAFEFNQYIKYIEEFSKFKKPVPAGCLDVLSVIGELKSDKVTFKSLLIDSTTTNSAVKTKKNLKVTLVGAVKGAGSGEFKTVEETYERFRTLPLWTEVPGYVSKAAKSPASVSASTQDKVIDFSFELPLEPQK